jgi:predicted lactoylglutathione lyase
MKTNVFVNLTTKDLAKAKEFFEGLGFTINKQFTNENAACVVIDQNIFAMIVTEPFFKKLVKHELLDSRKGADCAVCLTVDSKEAVDEMVAKALSLGGTENIVPEMSVGDSMYGKSVNDPDGHIWEFMWMDPKMIQK